VIKVSPATTSSLVIMQTDADSDGAEVLDSPSAPFQDGPRGAGAGWGRPTPPARYGPALARLGPGPDPPRDIPLERPYDLTSDLAGRRPRSP
jgi:hypothetical protein